MEKKLIVFDVDDTLYLEREYVRSGFSAVDTYLRKSRDVRGFFQIAWEAFLMGRRGDTFQYALSRLDIEVKREFILELVEIYRLHKPSISLLSDSRNALDNLKDEHFLGVLTDGPSQSQWAKIRALGLEEYEMRFIVTADHGSDWHKPATLGFLALQHDAGVEPEACLYIGDNASKDFQGPKSLGWKTIHIKRPNALYQATAGTGLVDKVVSQICAKDILSAFLP